MNTITSTATKTCINPTTPKVESKPKKFVRRLKQLAAPTHCSIRFDKAANMWAVIDEVTAEPKRHFTHGFMQNVSFRSESKSVRVGCGSHTDFIGVAEGDLIENHYSRNQIGFKNLGFDGQNFVNENNAHLVRASELQIMPDRRATYKP